MIGGCFKSVLTTIGCGAMLVVVFVVMWQYRGPLSDAYSAFRGLPVAEADTGPGRPSPEAFNSAAAKYRLMTRRDGPEFVSMTAAEVASLIWNGLDPVGRRAMDSLTVVLEEGRFVMEAMLVTAVWGREQLGLLGGLLQPLEPLRVVGPARIIRRGVLAWEPAEFAVRSIPLPRTAIPLIVNRLTGSDGGLLLIDVPLTVADVRIRPHNVIFYRRVQ